MFSQDCVQQHIVKRIAASAAIFLTERIVQASRIQKEKITMATEEFITKSNDVTTQLSY